MAVLERNGGAVTVRSVDRLQSLSSCRTNVRSREVGMLEDVVGRTYGPVEVPISIDRVAAFLAATSDDPQRWTQYAPPSFAGALLFAIAPSFLGDVDVAPRASMVIHGEQTFSWLQPFEVGTIARVRGTLERVRERGGVAFANFAMTVEASGARVLDAGSTFLMSGGTPPGGNSGVRAEPDPWSRGTCERPVALDDASDGPIPPLLKSASRADLVKYAGASRDFNPIHWDHTLAAAAGFGGVVAHGLLVAAWATQAATQINSGVRPLASGRIRFRNPLYPAEQADVTGDRDGDRVTVTVRSTGVEHVIAQFDLADGE